VTDLMLAPQWHMQPWVLRDEQDTPVTRMKWRARWVAYQSAMHSQPKKRVQGDTEVTQALNEYGL